MLDKPAPDFELPATGGKTFRLSQAKGSPLVLYFYPKDNTPGCTTEGQHFRDLYPEFQKLKCGIYGVSRDSIKSHENFKAKMKFPFDLLSDSGDRLQALWRHQDEKHVWQKGTRHRAQHLCH